MIVWIDEGCNSCGMCEEICPEVFRVDEDGCYVDEDNIEGNEDLIYEAADECPVGVIIISDEDEYDFDEDDDELDDDEMDDDDLDDDDDKYDEDGREFI